MLLLAVQMSRTIFSSAFCVWPSYEMTYLSCLFSEGVVVVAAEPAVVGGCSLALASGWRAVRFLAPSVLNESRDRNRFKRWLCVVVGAADGGSRSDFCERFECRLLDVDFLRRGGEAADLAASAANSARLL